MELKYIVKDETNLIKILKEKLSISNKLYRKIKNDYIFINGSKMTFDKNLKKDDIVTVKLDFFENNSNIIPNKDIKFNILYEDEWLLIVDKIPFIPVHPSMNYYTNSLSNGIKYYYDINNIHKKIRIINRLDKNTSGIVIFAKSEYIQDNIKIDLKEYVAIVEGSLDNKEGIINEPIKRKDDSIIERCIDKDYGEKAITYYKVINTLNIEKQVVSIVHCKLETGRTHQIRVHFSSIGHPVIGDTLYGNESNLISRQALHCQHMKFIHPVTKKEIDIISPIPNDMNSIINSIN